MNPLGRKIMLALAALVLIPAAFKLAGAMPAFGAHPLPYGDAISHFAPLQRHVTNAVTAVNFDYRGFDTLGEEFMLLAAVTGTVVLLRGTRGEDLSAKPGLTPGRSIPSRTDASVLVARLLTPVTLLFGIYVAVHASTTPGGGFQGGVIIASSLILVFLGETYQGWRRIVHSQAMDVCESGGALLFALMGFAPLFVGAAFATNILPLGRLRSALSGGTMLVFLEFMEETRRYEPGDSEPGAAEK